MVGDPEVLRLMAHLDQTRSEMRAALSEIDTEALAEIVKTCARGELADLDERMRLLVGMLAVVAIFDLAEPREPAA